MFKFRHKKEDVGTHCIYPTFRSWRTHIKDRIQQHPTPEKVYNHPFAGVNLPDAGAIDKIFLMYSDRQV